MDKTKTIGVRFRPDVLAQLEEKALAEKRPVAQLVRNLAIERLELDGVLRRVMKRTNCDSPAQAIDALLDLAGDA